MATTPKGSIGKFEGPQSYDNSVQLNVEVAEPSSGGPLSEPGALSIIKKQNSTQPLSHYPPALKLESSPSQTNFLEQGRDLTTGLYQQAKQNPLDTALIIGGAIALGTALKFVPKFIFKDAAAAKIPETTDKQVTALYLKRLLEDTRYLFCSMKPEEIEHPGATIIVQRRPLASIQQVNDALTKVVRESGRTFRINDLAGDDYTLGPDDQPNSILEAYRARHPFADLDNILPLKSKPVSDVEVKNLSGKLDPINVALDETGFVRVQSDGFSSALIVSHPHFVSQDFIFQDASDLSDKLLDLKVSLILRLDNVDIPIRDTDSGMTMGDNMRFLQRLANEAGISEQEGTIISVDSLRGYAFADLESESNILSFVQLMYTAHPGAELDSAMGILAKATVNHEFKPGTEQNWLKAISRLEPEAKLAYQKCLASYENFDR